MPSIPPPRLLNAVTPATSRNRRKLSRMSPLRMWLNSCATTPCSSSRSRNLSAPAVTQSAELSPDMPATNALTSLDFSSTHTDGIGTPEAIDISSHTLNSRSRARDAASFPFVRLRNTRCAPICFIRFSGVARSSAFQRKPNRTTSSEASSEMPTIGTLRKNSASGSARFSTAKLITAHAPHTNTTAAAMTTAAMASTASATSRPVFRRASSWSANGFIRT